MELEEDQIWSYSPEPKGFRVFESTWFTIYIGCFVSQLGLIFCKQNISPTN